jgi:hypothetical protein
MSTKLVIIGLACLFLVSAEPTKPVPLQAFVDNLSNFIVGIYRGLQSNPDVQSPCIDNLGKVGPSIGAIGTAVVSNLFNLNIGYMILYAATDTLNLFAKILEECKLRTLA